MNECDATAHALTAVALAVAATVLLCCSFVAAYIVRQVRSWQRWTKDD